jgi:hypothetical protein
MNDSRTSYPKCDDYAFFKEIFDSLESREKISLENFVFSPKNAKIQQTSKIGL